MPSIIRSLKVQCSVSRDKELRALRCYFAHLHPCEAKNKNCFSSMSSYLFIRKIAQVKSLVYRCYGNKTTRQIGK